MELSSRQVLGAIFGLLSMFSLVLNIIALLTVYRLAFIMRKNHVYIIAFFNILSDTLQMIVATFYLTPGIVTSSFLISDSKKNTWTLALSSLFLFLWYFESILQIVMALNRFVVICLQKHRIFTFLSTILLFVFLIPFCFLLMSYSQYFSACCSFMYDQEYLSYSYFQIGNITNYSNTFVDLPLNTSSSVISFICYVMIFWKIHHLSPTSVSVAGNQQKVRRNRDIRCAIQFSLLLAFYTFAWVLFRVLPVLLATQDVEWFILVPTLYTLNCTSNAVIYICFNGEVQSNLVPYKLHKTLEWLRLVRSTTPKNLSKISTTEQSRASGARNSQTAMRFIPARHQQPFRAIRYGARR